MTVSAFDMALLDGIAEGVLVTDREGMLVAVNSRLCETGALDRDAVIGRPFQEAVPHALRPVVDNAHRRLVEGETGSWRTDDPVCLDEDDACCLTISARVVRAPDGCEIIVFTISDVSAWIAALDQARAALVAAEERETALGGVGHDLRSTLAAIDSFAELIRDAAEPGKAKRSRTTVAPLTQITDFANTIRQGASIGLEMVDTMIELRRVRAGTVNLEDSPIDVLSVARKVMSAMGGEASRRGVRLRQRLNERLPLLNADPTVLKRVLQNLVSDALKFTDRDGSVVVASEMRDSGELVLSVTDTGIGDEGTEGSDSAEPTPASPRFGSAGLGLMLVKQFMEAHGGRMEIEGAAGAGTTVRLRFPMARTVLPNGTADRAAHTLH